MNKELTPFGFEIREKEGLINLTDIWREGGSDDSKRPTDWISRNGDFIETAITFLNATRNGIIKTSKGKGGGTHAHKQIALAYAKYISHKLHIAVNQIFFERLEEENNPELALERTKNIWRRKGKTDKWICERILSTNARKSFTSTLKEHGVLGSGYSDCTNAIYKPLWGGGAELVRLKKQLPDKSNCRDHMSEIELAGVRLAELLAEQNIEKHNPSGNKEVTMFCEVASKSIATAIVTNSNHYKNITKK